LAGDIKKWRELFLEEYFALQMYLHMGYDEIRCLPVRYRRWYLERLKKHFDNSKKSTKDENINANNISALNKFEESLQRK